MSTWLQLYKRFITPGVATAMDTYSHKLARESVNSELRTVDYWTALSML